MPETMFLGSAFNRCIVGVGEELVSSVVQRTITKVAGRWESVRIDERFADPSL
jgi:hypothetical protein